MKRLFALLLVACLALSACGKAAESPAYPIELGSSRLFTQQELEDAVLLVQMEFATWDGCEMHRIAYAGDELCTQENLDWLNELAAAREESDPLGEDRLQFTRCACFVSDFHSPVEEHEAEAWIHDYEYTDWQWWLGCTADGEWYLMTWGY